MPNLEAAAKAPIGWLRSHPFVFVLFFLVLALLAIRFRRTIMSAIRAVPVAGPRVAQVAGADAAS